ncbi:MAG TPA: hypothetical protein VMM78_04125 [Thermomicrobiales bacterium]|nr:hypothetical protein [Thermomicrobiales bacterium]
MTDLSLSEPPQPDLRQLVCDAVSQMMTMPDLPDDQRLDGAVQPDEIAIRCQRTWHDISTVNARINGGSFSACVGQFERNGELYSYFVEAVSPPGDSKWHAMGSSGGKMPAVMRDRAGGFMLSGGSHVCAGGLGQVEHGGTLRIEMADGTSYEDRSIDGCCIVFAPVTSAPSPDDHIRVRVFNADGIEDSMKRVRLGDGRTPPPRPER